MSARTTRFEDLLEAVPDALLGMDQNGLIRFVNRHTESLFGYDRDQLIGSPIDTLIPEPVWQIYDQNRPENHFADPGTRPRGLELEQSGRQQDGTEFPINITVSSIDTGDVLLVFTALRDVNQPPPAAQGPQRTAAMLTYSDDAIIGLTPDGTITSWTQAAGQMYGYSSKEVIGRSGDLLSPPDRAGDLAAVLAKIKHGRSVENAETVLVRKDGTPVPVSIAAAPIRDAGGAIVGVAAVHRDATMRRRAFESVQRMAAIIEGSNDAIIGSTLEGIISGSLEGIVTSWNPAAERMYGYSSEEMIGTPDRVMTPVDRECELTAAMEQVRAGRHVKNLQTKRVRKDGTVFPVSLTVSPIRGPDGTIVGTSVIHRDLSQQKAAGAVAEHMATIVECSDDAIISRTLDGIITSWNPAAARMFGYSNAEIVGKSIDVLVPQDRASEMITMLAEISAGRPVADFETTRIRKDGTMFPASLTVSPIRSESGTVVGASVIYRDVTKLKHAAQYARSLIEASLDPLETISPDGKITDVNEAAVKASGVPRSKLIGTDFSGYFTDPEKARQGYQQVFDQGSVTDYPLTLRRQDGTLTEVLCNASVYRDTGGNVLGVLAAARDMTQQKQAAEAAQRSSKTS